MQIRKPFKFSHVRCMKSSYNLNFLFLTGTADYCNIDNYVKIAMITFDFNHEFIK